MKVEKSLEEILKEYAQKERDRLRSEVRNYDARKLAPQEKIDDKS